MSKKPDLQAETEARPQRRSPRRALVSPVLLKTTEKSVGPPDERLFYLVARDGLYLCRQHEFFRSCVRANSGPSELAPQEPYFEPRFPQIPRDAIERAVGFFSRIADLHRSEAAVLLAWSRSERRVEIVVPHQTATVSESASGYRYPIGVHYDPPTDLPEDWVVFGDVHSHVDYAAYASHTDVQDELHSAGLHIVVGRIQSEPPELHVEAVVDEKRFVLQPEQVLEGYRARRAEVPDDWIDQVEVKIERYSYTTYRPLDSAH
ncbi:MAG: hypothetical protein JRG96_15735 [Deltaproteobacteria bacterium]|nr:hypothetical protein [Deltaproteobacteria bacterium]MBW2420135.1 hypothetical protein [Deltaproteobacteria bacterium]